MSDLTLPSPYSYSDGDAITSSDLNSFLYNDATPTSGFNIINGNLDSTNFASGLLVKPEYTQRGTFVDGWSAAGTANLDYTVYHFVGNTEDNNTYAEKPSTAKPIPGACRRIYLPRQSVVRVSWTIGWTNDCSNDDHRSRIILFINGTDEDSQVRQVGRTISSSPTHQGYRKNRWWSGHHQDILAQGWHNIGLRAIADEGISQTRIWARHIDIIAFTD